MSADLADSAVPDVSGTDLALAEVGLPLNADPLLGKVGEPAIEARDSVETWTAVLDALEDAIDEAATAVDPAAADLIEQTAVLANWTPPAVAGPIPESLIPRARLINERQHAALGTLTAELQTLRQHRSVLGSVQTATAPEHTSVYLDVTG